MKTLAFISSLLPSFTTSRMREDLDLIREDLKTIAIPVYTTMVNAYGKNKFQAKELQTFEKYFQDEVKTKFRGNSIAVIEQVLKRMLENCESLENIINENYSNDVVREAMTFFKANVLQYMETMSFVITYSRRHLLWVVSVETANNDPENSQPSGLVPADVEWLQVNRLNFFTALTIMSGEKEEIKKNFQEIPDIVATKENVPVIEKTVGITRTDPFRFGLIPVWLNPIYHVRMKVAEYQVARFNTAKKEKEVLEMRILDLKQRQAGKKDARLQEQIEYNEGRLNNLKYELKKMEEEYSHA